MSYERSTHIMETAKKSIAGGASSTMRVLPYQDPLVISRCEGPYVWDYDGNRLIDLNMGYGALLLGHRPGVVIDAMKEELDRRGSVLGFVHELPHEAAHLIKEAFPSIESLRFCSTGTEAGQTAIRLARAQTGRPFIVLFEGQYHGSSEAVFHRYHATITELEQYPCRPLSGTGGMKPTLDNAYLLPWNDQGAISDLFDAHGEEIAAVIMEPVCGNAGVIPPEPGYLDFVRQKTRQYGALLVFDEVITGFRVARGGAQERFGVRSDITMLSKAMGAGSIAAAVGASYHIMDRLVKGQVFHGGVFSASPVNMAGVLAAQLEYHGNHHSIYEHLDRVSDRLAMGLQEIFRDHNIPVAVQHVGAMLSLVFQTDALPHAPRNYRQKRIHANEHRFIDFHRRLRAKGVFVHPNYLEPWYLSTAHTTEVVNTVLNTVSDVAGALALP